MARIKKTDTVQVISGKDKGKVGDVIAILHKKSKIKVKGVAIATHHVKARKQGDTSGIKKEESYVQLSVVMPVCNSCKKPTRIGSKELADGSRVRMCNKCKEIM